MTTPTDPLFADQWHLGMIGNIQRIWDEYRGTGVKVAVYDEGVQYAHADLRGNYDASMEFIVTGQIPRPRPIDSYAAHGTACAGIIAATANNGIGGVGVAWGASLTGVDFLNVVQTYFDPSVPDDLALYTAALRHAANFDIMSNSWGVSGDYRFLQNLLRADSYASVTSLIYSDLSAIGRGGLGTIIVQAAGNDALDAGGDGINVSRHTITVAAVEQTGFAADYSNWGPSILISAPAAAVTTDMAGGGGYNRTNTDTDPLHLDYTSEFNGTSAATPVVAGVVALMLEANPDLGWRDVHNILAMSAAHTGSDYDAPSAEFETGNWYIGANTHWNGGGNAIHYSYGYGMVDAFAAVRMAEAWLTFGAPAQTSVNEQTVVVDYDGAAVPVPDYIAATNTDGIGEITLNVTDSISIETIYITVNIAHSSPSDLMVSLILPDGGEFPIAFQPDKSGTGLRWVYAIDQLRGHDSAGEWTLRVKDIAAADVGSIRDVKIEFFGSESTTDTVFHFTNDFLALAALDSSRRSIDDLDGGTDWANFAALEHNLQAKLRSEGAIRVDGTLWARFAQTEIENLYAGDGNDSLLGNSLANHLIGARGNDRLVGGAGDDRLEGSAGKDQLTGGTGNDVLTGGEGSDSFVFTGSFGTDIITDFTDNVDTLRLDDALWSGVRTVAQVLAEFAGIDTEGNTTLTFGAQKITLVGLADQDLLLNDLVIF